MLGTSCVCGLLTPRSTWHQAAHGKDDTRASSTLFIHLSVPGSESSMISCRLRTDGAQGGGVNDNFFLVAIGNMTLLAGVQPLSPTMLATLHSVPTPKSKLQWWRNKGLDAGRGETGFAHSRFSHVLKVASLLYIWYLSSFKEQAGPSVICTVDA